MIGWFRDLALEVLIHRNAIGRRLATIEGAVLMLVNEVKRMNTNIVQLQADVAAEDGVIRSAVVLIEGFSARLDAAIAKAGAGDTQALTDLSADVKASTQALAQAVAANTPPADVPPAPPAPTPEPPPAPAPPPADPVIPAPVDLPPTPPPADGNADGA